MCLVYLAESLGQQMVADYWRSIIRLNDFQVNRLSERIIQALGNNVTGKRIAVLGLSFKDGVRDTTDSPSLAIIKTLALAGANLAVFDPRLTKTQIDTALGATGLSHKFRKIISSSQDLRTACKSASAVLLLADPKSFPSSLDDQSGVEQLGEDTNCRALLPSPDDFDWVAVFLNMTHPHYVLDCRNYVDIDTLKKIGFVVDGIGKRGF